MRAWRLALTVAACGAAPAYAQQIEPFGSHASFSDMFHSVAAPGDHVLAMKTTFWISAR
jgi:hypothetical protein